VPLIARAPALANLDLYYSDDVDDDTIAALAACKTLAALNITGRGHITAKGFPALVALPALTKLSIIDCKQREITDAAFVALSKSRTLKTLCIGGCYQTTITSVACEALAAMPALTRLDLRDCKQLSERAFAALAQSRTLIELDASDCDWLLALGALGASSSPQHLSAPVACALTTLRLYWEGALEDRHSDALARLAHCSTLRYLDLTVFDSAMQMPFESLCALAPCAALETLVLAMPRDDAHGEMLRRALLALPQLRLLQLQLPASLEPADTSSIRSHTAFCDELALEVAIARGSDSAAIIHGARRLAVVLKM
jgi:hypothetical protein